jgi:hypothetical protein
LEVNRKSRLVAMYFSHFTLITCTSFAARVDTHLVESLVIFRSKTTSPQEGLSTKYTRSYSPWHSHSHFHSRTHSFFPLSASFCLSVVLSLSLSRLLRGDRHQCTVPSYTRMRARTHRTETLPAHEKAAALEQALCVERKRAVDAEKSAAEALNKYEVSRKALAVAMVGWSDANTRPLIEVGVPVTFDVYN